MAIDPKLLDMVVAGQIATGHMVTHRFALDDIMQAYDVFSRPGETGALTINIDQMVQANVMPQDVVVYADGRYVGRASTKL